MEQIVFLVLLIAVFYLLLIRPQQKRTRDHQGLVANLAEGDEVVTIGGAFGRVTRMDDATLWLNVGNGVEIRFAKQAISRKIEPEPELEPEPEPDETDQPSPSEDPQPGSS